MNNRVVLAILIGLPVITASSVAIYLSASRKPEVTNKANEWNPSTGLVFEVRPETHSPSEAAAIVAEMLPTRALGMVDPVADDQAGPLAAAARRRLEIMLSASFDDWIAEVQKYAERPDLTQAGKPDPEYQRKWLIQASTLAFVPVSAEHTQLRWVRRRGVDVANTRSQLVVGPIMGASYSDEDKPGAARGDIIEVLVPMKIKRIVGGSAEIPSRVGIQMRWDQARRDWRPHQLRVYMDSAVNDLILPVF